LFVPNWIHVANGSSGSPTGQLVVNGALTTGGLTINDSQNNATGSTGVVVINTGGVINSNGDTVVSFAGSGSASGELRINSGGTFNIGAIAERWLIMNQWDTAQGRIVVDGGALNLLNNTDIRFSTGSYAPGAGTGTSSVTLSNNGSITGGAGSVIDFNYGSSGSPNNTVDLEGGTLTIGQLISTRGGGTRAFIFNGGTLKAAGASTAFFGSGVASAATINAGGGTIDNAGYDIAIGQVFGGTGGLTFKDTGSGATTTLTGRNTFTGAAVIDSGTVYVNPGNGATNAAFSYVSGITVSSGATLSVGNNGLFGWDGSQAKPITVNGGTLTTAGANESNVGNITLNGGTLAGGGDSAWGGFNLKRSGSSKLMVTDNATISASYVGLGAANSVDVSSGKTLTFSGLLADVDTQNGPNVLNKTGAGTMILTASNTYTGATNINSGTLQLGDGTVGHDGLIGSASVSGSTGATLVFNRAGSSTGSFAISGGLGVRKLGAGAQILTGASSYTGPTTINAGALTFSTNTQNLASSAFTVADGAGLGVKAASSGTTLLTTNSLALGSGGTTALNFDFSSLDTSAALISTGAFTINGSATVNLFNAALLSTGRHMLVDYTSFTGSAPTGTFSISPRSTGILVNDSVHTALSLDVQADTPKWTGLDGSSWKEGSTGASSNWKLVSANTATDYIEGDAVLFDDSVIGSTIVDIDTANVSPASVIFNNIANDYTVTSSNGFGIAGIGLLSKSGDGKLTLETSNSYSGGTTINGGTIAINSESSLGDVSGALTLNAGTLQTTADITSARAITVGAANSTIQTDEGTTYTVTGLVSGIGGLVKSGAGTLVLTATNTYAGPTTVNAGTLQIDTTAGPVSTGTFNLAGGALIINSPAPNWSYSPAINLTGAGSTLGSTGSQINYGGTIAGNGNALNINNANSPTSRIYLNGVLDNVSQINVQSGALGFWMDATGSRGTTIVNVAEGASLWYAGVNANPISNALTFNGGDGVNSTGALYYEDGATVPAPISSAITLANGITGIGSQNGATITLNGNITGPGGLKQLNANIILSGSNDYSGGTTITTKTLTANTSTALGTGDVSLGSAVGTQLALGSGVNVANALAMYGGGSFVGQGSLYVPTGDATYSGTITINGAVSTGGHFATGGGTLTLAGPVTSYVPVQVRSGTITFSNAGNSFNALNIQGGTVKYGVAGAIPNGSTVSLGQSGASTLDMAGYNASFASLNQSANDSTVTNSGSSDVTLTTTGDSTFGGRITDGATNKTALIIGGGTFYANRGNAATNQVFSSMTGGLTVNNGATLRTSANALFGWDGTQEHPITVNAGGTLLANGGLSSDVGLGTVTLNGGTMATLAGGATDWGSFRFDEATDRLIVTDNSTVSAQNVKFGNQSAAIDVAAGKRLDFTGSVTDANGGKSYLTKSGGSGALVLAGSNTYTGATTVNAGTIILQGSINGSITTVNDGAALTGTGALGDLYVSAAISGTTAGGAIDPGEGEVSVSSNGTVAGNGMTGRLTTGNFNLGSGAHLSMQLGGTTAGTEYDQLLASSVSLMGDAQIHLINGYTPTAGDRFYLVLNGAGSAVGGNGFFSAINGQSALEGATVNIDGSLFTVTYLANGDGGSLANDIALQAAVPEPGTWAMIVGGMGMLGLFQRRRGFKA
jgi:autotransporter-associated beta strand protein